MPNHLIIIPCGQLKVWDKTPEQGNTPAKDVYIGSPFKMNRRYAEAFSDRWVILSAKYGFINPSYSISEPYNVTFKKKSTQPIDVAKLRTQIKRMKLHQYSTIVGLGGVDYRHQIIAAFEGLAEDLVFPFAGLPIGEGLKALKQTIQRDLSVNKLRETWLVKSRKAVLQAIEEFDRNGREDFLKRYGFKASSRYMIKQNGRSYDSKAILGVAHGYDRRGAKPLAASEFSGGAATVQKNLRRLGFRVVKSNTTKQRKPRRRTPLVPNINDIESVCDYVHKLLRNLPRHTFAFDDHQIPKNGIYVLFENGERGHGGRRIVRIGTHTGQNQLCSRLRQHFIQENKDRSIFRKNIGRCLLNRSKDPFLADWNLDLTTRANRKKHSARLNHKKQLTIEGRVTKYMQENFEFAVFEVPEKEQRLLFESRLISIISRCKKCKPSPSWLGLDSPVAKIRESGLWQVMELYKEGFSEPELRQFMERLSIDSSNY